MSTVQATTFQSKAVNAPPKFLDDGAVEVGRVCRAFASFNGGTNPPSFFSAFNVSSITDTAVGAYTVNYARALPAQGCPVASSARPQTIIGSPTETGVSITTRDNAGTQQDAGYVSVATFES